MILFYGLVFVCLVWGFIHEINTLKHISSRIYPEAEISWKQPPFSLWQYETISMVAITIHTLGFVSLTILLLVSLNRIKFLHFFPNLDQGLEVILGLVFFLIAIYGVGLTAFVSSVVISYQLLQPWRKPVSYGISNEGKFYAGHLLSWKIYSHYEVDPVEGLISLYSSYSPTLRTSIMKPPPELFSNVLGIIQQHLPSTPSIDYSTSWQHSPITLIIGMTLLVISTLLPAVWGLTYQQSWVWIYIIVIFFVLNNLGLKLLAVFDGRGKYPMKKAQTN